MATRLNSAVLDHSGSKVDGLEKGEEAGGGGVCRGLGILTPFGMSWARSSKQLLPTVRQAQGWGWAGCPPCGSVEGRALWGSGFLECSTRV